MGRRDRLALASRRAAAVGVVVLALAAPHGAVAHAAGATAATATCPPGHPPDFVAGTIRQVAAQRLTVQVAGSCAPPLAIGLAPTTQICRHTCAATWRDLRRGDRVAAALAPGQGGAPTARWVDANSVAGSGIVTALAPGAVTIVLTRGTPGAAHVLLVGPDTVVAQANGAMVSGNAGDLRVGDAVYFTGTMDRPEPQTRNIWAVRVFQLGPQPGATLPGSGGGGTAGDGRAGPALALLLALGLLLSGRFGRRAPGSRRSAPVAGWPRRDLVP